MNLPPHGRLIAQNSDVHGEGNFFQGCSFSPDGLCVLTATAGDTKMRLYNTAIGGAADQQVQEWTTELTAQGGDVVRSYSWYPRMSSNEPATCCFAASSRDQPVHLYDAYSGAIRATYRPYNSLDEMESPTVVHFSCDGKRIVCGGFRSDRVIHIFDLAVPGRDSTVLRLGKTRRSTDGQKGLVSALASTHDGRYFAVGTYAPGSIYIYDDRSGHFPNNTVLNGLCVVGHGKGRKRRFVDTEENNTTDDEPVVDHQWIQHAKTKWFQGRAQGGVTQLQFAPDQEYLLYSASRRSDAILLWDLRMLSDTNEGQPIRGIGSFRTLSDTNQRLEFDLSEDGNTLYAGGMDRCVRIYDTQSTKLLGTLDQMDDAVNGVSFTHLTSTNKSYLAVATGSRRFPEDKEEDEDTKSPDGAVTPGYLRLFELTGKTGEELDDFGKTT